MTAQTKTRAFLASPVSGLSRPSGFASWGAYSLPGVSCSETVNTISHAWLGTRWSGGGNFDLWRNIQTFSPNVVKVKKTSGTSQIDGTARMGSALGSTYPMSQYNHPSDATLLADGATAIARTEPLNPSFDLSVFLGELRAEGLPNMPGTAAMEATRRARSAGSEYLNVEFGWLPLVRGIRDFANTVENSDTIIRNFQEGANKVIQRGYEWPLIEESHAEPINFGSVPSSGGSFQGGGCWQYKRQQKWFEAEYIYYLPTGGSTNDKFRRYGSYARKLLGIDLSPEVLWNLSPWSWAADWFSNVGDVMHNVSAIGQDGLVMRNGYIMCHTRYERQDSGRNTLSGDFCTHHTISERKTRRGASPYGFGVSYDGLSTKQLAIISALGLSRW